MQVISLIDAHFAKAGLPVYLRPYTVIPNRSGLGNNIGAILEVIPNVRDSICIYKLVVIYLFNKTYVLLSQFCRINTYINIYVYIHVITLIPIS